MGEGQQEVNEPHQRTIDDSTKITGDHAYRGPGARRRRNLGRILALRPFAPDFPFRTVKVLRCPAVQRAHAGTEVSGDSIWEGERIEAQIEFRLTLHTARPLGGGNRSSDVGTRWNDNPSIDAGVEDAHLGDALYLDIMREFLRRMERKRQGSTG